MSLFRCLYTVQISKPSKTVLTVMKASLCVAVESRNHSLMLHIVCIYLSVCPQEMGMRYGIPWDSTVPGGTSLQNCGAGYTGKCIAIEVCVVFVYNNCIDHFKMPATFTSPHKLTGLFYFHLCMHKLFFHIIFLRECKQ